MHMCIILKYTNLDRNIAEFQSIYSLGQLFLDTKQTRYQMNGCLGRDFEVFFCYDVV